MTNIYSLTGFCIVSEVAQLYPILCNSMDCSLPRASVHGIFQARVLEWVAISSSRGIFPTQESNPGLPHCRQMLYHLSHQGSSKREKNTVSTTCLQKAIVRYSMLILDDCCSPVISRKPMPKEKKKLGFQCAHP